MRITERDIALLRWINGFGFVFCYHIAGWMAVSYQTAHARLHKLIDAGYLTKKRKHPSLPNLIYLTKKGWALAGDPLPRLQSYNRLNSFNHDVRIIDLSLSLQRQFPGSQFLTERRIRYREPLKKKQNRPDGELVLPTDMTIAIELELTQKSQSRLKRIIRQYRANLTYDAIWYFAPADLIPVLQKAIGSDPFFKLHKIEYQPCL